LIFIHLYFIILSSF